MYWGYGSYICKTPNAVWDLGAVTEGYKVKPPAADPKLKIFGLIFLGRVGPQGLKVTRIFYLTKWREYGTIPYNLNERIKYGLFSTKNTS